MAYVKQTWANLPSETTLISAGRLGHIEDGIFDAAAAADEAAADASTAAAGTATNTTAVADHETRIATLEGGDLGGLAETVEDHEDRLAAIEEATGITTPKRTSHTGIGNGADVIEAGTIVIGLYVDSARTLSEARLTLNPSGTLAIEVARAIAADPTDYTALFTITVTADDYGETLAMTHALAAGDFLRLAVTGAPADVTLAGLSLTYEGV